MISREAGQDDGAAPKEQKQNNSQRNWGAKNALLQTLIPSTRLCAQRKGVGMPFVSKDNLCGCGLLSPGLASALVICVTCPVLCVMLRESQGCQTAKGKH